MSEKSGEGTAAPADDADIAAVRSVIEKTATQIADVDDAWYQATAPVAGLAQPDRQAAGGRRTGQALMAFFWSRLRSYRPERRAILVTSAVLLLLLQPVYVIGWGVLFGIIFIAFYLIVGEERFWRGVISHYRRFARRRPEAARRLKLRAWVLSRRWDRYTGYLPDAAADALRSPDLRGMIVADQRHAAAMSERLNRLSNERAG